MNEVSVGADATFEKLVFAQLFGDFGSSSWSTGENQIESLVIHVIGPSRSARARRIVGGGTIGGIDAVEWLAEFVTNLVSDLESFSQCGANTTSAEARLERRHECFDEGE